MKKAAVIMAGGSGERFWPLSRRSKPKQFMKIHGDVTLLEKTVENISGIFPMNNIFLVTGKHLYAPVADSGIPFIKENIIFEPFKRNTTGCLALFAAEMISRNKQNKEHNDVLIGAFPADHFIADTEKFRETILTALNTAEHNDVLVTLGINPSYPETGYGYIKVAKEIQNQATPVKVFHAEGFCEKPDYKTAVRYLEEGGYFWNSGMFFWKLSVFMSEMEKTYPALICAISEMSDAISINDGEKLCGIFKDISDISIDYSLLEKSGRVTVVKADFGWDDIGSWAAIERFLSGDTHGNRTIGDPVVIDSENCLVVNGPGKEKMSVGVIGVKNLSVIVTEDGVLVVPRDRVQEVKKVVEELKKRGSKHL